MMIVGSLLLSATPHS